VDEIAAIIIKEIRDALQPRSDLPEYFRMTIRLSVMGFLGYLDWNAKQ
jgi:hypothetical protein